MSPATVATEHVVARAGFVSALRLFAVDIMSGGGVIIPTSGAPRKRGATNISRMSPFLTMGTAWDGGVIDPRFTPPKFVVNIDHSFREGLQPGASSRVANFDEDGDEGLVGALRFNEDRGSDNRDIRPSRVFGQILEDMRRFEF